MLEWRFGRRRIRRPPQISGGMAPAVMLYLHLRGAKGGSSTELLGTHRRSLVDLECFRAAWVKEGECPGGAFLFRCLTSGFRNFLLHDKLPALVSVGLKLSLEPKKGWRSHQPGRRPRMNSLPWLQPFSEPIRKTEITNPNCLSRKFEFTVFKNKQKKAHFPKKAGQVQLGECLCERQMQRYS